VVLLGMKNDLRTSRSENGGVADATGRGHGTQVTKEEADRLASEIGKEWSDLSQRVVI